MASFHRKIDQSLKIAFPVNNTESKIPFNIFGVVLAIGIVFGDIGTSPLYVMQVVMNNLPIGQLTRPDYILGAVSCVIWTLTLQTTLKYVIITLKADNNGEGGILSLYALVREKYRWAYILAAVGAATLLADGIITPAMTVLSAVEGLQHELPMLSAVPIALIIVFLVFMVQPFGTGSLGKYFGFYMVLWFAMMGIVGGCQLAGNVGVLRAFNPYYAIHFLVHVPNMLIMVGAIFLCTTGAEALYSDLGHCGLKNIRTSWAFVKTTLILNYLGQAAWIINHPELNHPVNPFFAMMPHWFTFVGIGMATLAAIIASQALISGSFTVISEATYLNLWPNVMIKYPTRVKGQLYIPSVNHLMMVLCLLIILMFGSSLKLEAAYGLAITLSMLMTSILLFLYFMERKRPLWFSLPLTSFFVFIEFSFFVANMQKFMCGGYIPVMMATLITLVMYSWYNGRLIKQSHTLYDKVDSCYLDRIVRISNDVTIPKIATNLVYIVKSNRTDSMESKIGYSLFKRTPKRADNYWFVHIKHTDDPYEFHYKATILVPQKVFRSDIFAGFKLGIHADKYITLITNKMESDGLVNLSSRYPSMQGCADNRGDFLYMVVDRIFRNVHMSPSRQIIFSCYNLVKRVATSDTQMYDIDPTEVKIEKVPLKRSDLTEDDLNALLENEAAETDS